MSFVFELLATLAQMFIWLWFLTEFLGYKTDLSVGRIGFIVTLFALQLELNYVNNIVVYDGFLALFFVFTVIVYALLFLNGEVLKKIFVVAYSTAIIFTISTLVLFLCSYYSGKSTGDLISKFTVLRILIICVCRVLEFIVFKSVIKINDRYALTKKEWILFITMPVLTWSVITLMTKVAVENEAVVPQMFYIAVVMLVINIIIYVFMFKMKQDTQTKIEYELLKMQHDNIKKMELNMKALYESTYSVKHDLEKHLLAVKAMAESSCCEEIGAYVDKIVDNNLNDAQKIVFTSNDVFNAIVNTKLEMCRAKKIITNINISNEAIRYIETADIVILFGNIFDNAIEAAEKTDRRIIMLDVRLQREYVSIYMENSFDSKSSSIELKTTKPNHSAHGIGIKNVRKVVENNDGMIDYFKNEDGMFCCDILLKKHSEMQNSAKK